jgi:hypothetical protein
MKNAVTIYCDESGNDGPNYLNEEQPFYVLAGWIASDEAVVNASVEIEMLRQRIGREAPELKFKTFKKSESKRQMLFDLVCRLGGVGLVPIYLVAEKRYCVAGKIVETFLDPYYNPLLKRGMTWDVRTKLEIANTLYSRLPDDVLRSFAHAYREPTENDLADALRVVAGECRKRVNPELAELLDGSQAKLNEIAAAEVEAASKCQNAGGTLNLPCLITFLMMVEQMARNDVFDVRKIVHDEQGPYEKGYREAFHLHRNAGDGWITLEGRSVGYGAIRRISEFEMQRSVDQPLIQAADLLAGAVNDVCIDLVRGRHITGSELELAGLTLPILFFRDIKIGWPVLSERMLDRIKSLLGQLYPLPAVNSDEFSDLATGDLLPPLRTEVTAPAHKRMPADLPMFGVTNLSEDKLLVMVSPDCDPRNVERYDRCVPLFTSVEQARAFQATFSSDWTEPHQIRRFDAPDLVDLVHRLEHLIPYTDRVVFDMLSGEPKLVNIVRFVSGLKAVVERMIHAGRTGIMDTLVQRHLLPDGEAMSMLLSSGQYSAMRLPAGRIFSARTREEAIRMVAEGSDQG